MNFLLNIALVVTILCLPVSFAIRMYPEIDFNFINANLGAFVLRALPWLLLAALVYVIGLVVYIRLRAKLKKS